jgi:hypothetical protein
MLILLCIGALVYFGLLSPNKLVPDKCIASVGFNCIDSALSYSSQDSLVILATANKGNKISITNLSVNVKGAEMAVLGGCGIYDADGVQISMPAEIQNTAKFMIKCTSFKEALSVKKGSSIEANVKFEYVFNDELSHEAYISVTGVFR